MLTELLSQNGIGVFRLSAPPCAPLFSPRRVSAVRRPSPPLFYLILQYRTGSRTTMYTYMQNPEA